MYFCCNHQKRKSQFSLTWASWSTLPSGVQRLFDAQGERGSRMAIRKKLFLSIHLLKFLTNFIRMPPLSGIPGAVAFFSFIFKHFRPTTLFLRKLPRWMPPRLDARGRRTTRTSVCTPLTLPYIYIGLVLMIGVELLANVEGNANGKERSGIMYT